MVEFDKRTSHYRLGLKAYRLGSVVAKSMELVKQGDPLLAGMAEETSETAFLVVPDGNEALCVRRFDGSHQIRVLYLEPGKRSRLQLRRGPAGAPGPSARRPLGRRGGKARHAA